jgi:serine acetyltransferase
MMNIEKVVMIFEQPSAVIAGDVQVKENAVVGANAVVIDDLLVR